MNTTHLDLNADLGESFGAYTIGNDADVLTLVSSANIACGFHAGDPRTMWQTLQEAKRQGVRVGAHPGYRDLAGFGRRAMAYSPAELEAELRYQIGALRSMAQQCGVDIAYVKPHGALYNTVAHNKPLAQAVFAAMRYPDAPLAIMALAGSPIVEWATQAGIAVIKEAFADRAYQADGTLVPRSQPGAVHHDPVIVAQQAVALAQGEAIRTIDGSELHIRCDSLCVHGDNAKALDMIRAIRSSLEAEGIGIQA